LSQISVIDRKRCWRPPLPGEVAVVVDDGLALRVLVVEADGGFGFEEEVVVEEVLHG
jgi:hypothetical protein